MLRGGELARALACLPSLHPASAETLCNRAISINAVTTAVTTALLRPSHNDTSAPWGGARCGVWSGQRGHSSVTAGVVQPADEAAAAEVAAAERGGRLSGGGGPPSVSPASFVHPSAVLCDGAVVGPFCAVGPNVTIGQGCRLMGHNVLMGHTWLGDNNTLLHGAIIGSEDAGETAIGESNTFGHHSVVGARCQDLKRSPTAECFLRIGDGNDIREFVSIHRSSTRESETRIGDGNLLMGSCHVGHDVSMGNRCIAGNNSLFAGHVVIGDFVRVSGACAVQPRVALGSYAYLTGGSMVDRDVPPFTIVQGDRAMIRGLNEVLMSRCGFSAAEKHDVRAAFQALWGEGEGTYSGLQQRAAQLMQQRCFGPNARLLLHFVYESLAQTRFDGRVGAVCHLMPKGDRH